MTFGGWGATMTGMRTGVGIAVLVAAAAIAATAAAAPVETVAYGKSVTLTGKVPAGIAGSPHATVLSKPCGFKTFVTLAKPPFPKSGTFTYSIAPTLGTQFLVLIADRHVVELTVRVQPRITLTRTGNQYKVEVTTGNGAGLGGRTAVLEQKSASGGWKRVGTTKLKLTSQPDQIDAVAGGLARATLKGSGPVRARISAAQAAPCFAPVASPPLR